MAWLDCVATSDTPLGQGIDRTGLLIGVAVGVPAAVAAGAITALFRDVFNSTNAALVLMIVVVAVAALGGRAAGVVTALAAVVSFDFFHTRPYLSLTIDSRDDVETTILLLVAGLIVGTVASHQQLARRRAGSANAEIRRIHRVAEAAASSVDAATVIAAAQDELARPPAPARGALRGLALRQRDDVPAPRPQRAPRGAASDELRAHFRRHRWLRAAA